MNPFEHAATAERLRWLAGQGLLSPAELEHALGAAGLLPTPQAWARFLSRALLVLGAALGLAGVFFFFAYNWDDLHRFVKLGLLMTAVAGCGGFALWRGLERLEGQVALFASCTLLGALLAVFGQVYQTGADSFLLFASWAALILVPTLLGRSAPLWMLLLVLLNLALFFFLDQRTTLGYNLRPIPLFALNTLWLLGWELGRARGAAWMASLWYRRGALLSAAGWGTFIVLLLIFDDWVPVQSEPALLAGGATALALGAVAAWYFRWRAPDLPALSLLALCMIIIVTVQLFKWIGWHNALGFTFLSALVVVQILAASLGLLRAAQRMEVAR